MKHLLASAVTLGLFCTAAPAMAEVDRTADTVVVTAGRVAESQKNVTQSMTVITSEEIEKNQYQDMGHMLLNYGIEIGGYGSPNQGDGEIRIRGMGSSTMDTTMQSGVQFLINGHRVAMINISTLPLVAVEQVEILRGPASVQYGNSAIGGIINVILKRGTEIPQASVEFGAASWDGWRAMAGGSGKFSMIDFAGGVTWSSQNDNYTTGNGTEYPYTSHNDKINYALNFGVNFLDDHRLGFSLVGNDYSDMQGNELPLAQADNVTKWNTDSYAFAFDYDGAYTPLGLIWKLGYHNSRQKKDNYYSSYGPSYTREEMQGINGQLSWKYDFLTLTGGLEWMDYSYEGSYSNGLQELENISAFLLGKVALFDERLILSAGTRYDTYTQGLNGKEENLSNVSFSGGVAYHALDWLTFRANIGQSYQVPVGTELVGGFKYYDGSDIIGNPDLDPEEGFGWDIGFEVNYNGFNAGLTYFWTDYKNYIALVPFAGNQRYENLDGTSKFRGIEGQASYDLGQAFDWDFMLKPYVNFTHYLTFDDYKGQEITGIPDWTAGFGVAYSHPDLGLNVDLRFVYVAKNTGYDSSIYDYRWTDDALTADLFISKVLWDMKDAGKVSLKAEIRNLFDVEYEYTANYPMPGRGFYVGLRYDYN